MREHPLPLAVSFAALFFATAAANGATSTTTLYFDDQPTYEREIAPGEVHAYGITLKAGEFVRFVAVPVSVDLALRFESPAEKQIAAVDQPGETADPETLSAVAEVAGRYRLLVSVNPKWGRSGSYVVRVDDRRPAVLQDRDRMEAERLFIAGEEGRTKPTAETLRSALQSYTQALAIWRRLNDDAQASDALNNIGVLKVLQGDPRGATAHFFEALVLRQCIPDQRSVAPILSNIAVNLQELGRDRESIDFARAVLRESRDTKVSMIAVYMTGIANERLGDYQKSLQIFLQTVPLAIQSGDRQAEAAILNAVGISYTNRAQWREGLIYLGRSLALRRAIGDRRGEAATLSDIGGLYSRWGDRQRALDQYQKALDLSRETRYTRLEAAVLQRLGNVYELLSHDPDGAIRYYEQALKLYREAKYKPDEAQTLAFIGRAHAAKGEFKEAISLYTEALAAKMDPVRRAVILVSVVEAQARVGDTEAAIRAADEAIAILSAAGHRTAEAHALYGRARTFQLIGKLDEARADLERALQLVEGVRVDIGTYEARALFLASNSEISDFYIRLLMQLHKKNPTAGFDRLALQASERARARTLADYLSDSPVDARDPNTRAILNRQREVRELLSLKAEAQLRAVGAQRPQELAAAIGREMGELTTEYDQLAARLRASSPVNASEALDVTAIQHQVVDPATTLVEYSLGKEKSFVWVVTPASVHSYELAGRDEIEAAVRAAYDALSAKGKSRQALESVSRLILAPAASDLTAKRLLVVSDGALNYLPFGVLPSPRNLSRPLILDHEIVNIPSASTTVLLRRFPRHSAATKTLAVFADPVFDGGDERVRSTAHPVMTSENTATLEVARSAQESGLAPGALPRLPFTRREANALLALVRPERRKVALDFDASREEALSATLRNYRIVHFATHGLLNSLHPELSGIVLSMVDEKGGEQPGFLTVADVLNMSLGADLVVLSGCRTALGKEIKGEGIAGLSRAFMSAGAPRVVASVWKVDDAATAALMQRFYAAMLGPRKLPASAALRAAQVSLRSEKRWQDPYYWAAFEIQGEWK